MAIKHVNKKRIELTRQVLFELKHVSPPSVTVCWDCVAGWAVWYILHQVRPMFKNKSSFLSPNYEKHFWKCKSNKLTHNLDLIVIFIFLIGAELKSRKYLLYDIIVYCTDLFIHSYDYTPLYNHHYQELTAEQKTEGNYY